MSAPGLRLRAFAARICSPRTLERLVDPIVADLQAEYAAGAPEGTWRRRRVLWLAYAGFWKALILYGALSMVRPADRREERTLGRTLAFSSFGFLLFTVALVLPPLVEGLRWSGGRAERALLALYLIPQALPLSIPAGICLGVLCAMRASAVTRRQVGTVLIVGMMASTCAWVLMEWGVPRANMAFRDLVAAQLAADGRVLHLEPGLNELGLSRLGRRTDGEAVRHYYLLWALCFATIPLAVFALGMAGRIRRLVSAMALAFAASLGYVGVMMAVDNLSHGTLPQVIAAVWAPNLLFVTAGGLMLGMRSGKRAVVSGSES